MDAPLYVWLLFGALVATMMILDLGVFHRKARAVSIREAAGWTVAWVTLALAFNAFIYYWRGRVPAIEFLTGYIIEWSLSMDNVFVFAVIFTYFAVPSQYQHRVLFWGILGAVVMRLLFILIGAALLARFHWLIYPMGLFLVFTGIKLLRQSHADTDLDKNLALRWARRWFPVTPHYVGKYFFVRRSDLVTTAQSSDGSRSADGASSGEAATAQPATPAPQVAQGDSRWMVTPLFLVLLVVETTDVAFAVDSIPAIFAVTRDPFIIFSSNVFAILGLRALYFLLAGAIGLFRYLSVGLAAILCFIGVKMLVSGFFHIPIALSLGLVGGTLVVAVAASLVRESIDARRAAARAANSSTDSQQDKLELTT